MRAYAIWRANPVVCVLTLTRVGPRVGFGSFARADADLAKGVRVPHAWRSLQPRGAFKLAKAAGWD
jgi:hypothetical protein